MSEAIAPADGGQGTASTSSALLSSATATSVQTVQPGQTSSAPVSTSAQMDGTAPAASTTPTTAQPLPWLTGADETTLGYVRNKGWTDPAQVLDGYRNLEKLLGAERAGQTVVLPKEGADPKEWASIYDRMGRPTGPDGYKVELPQGGDAKVQSAVLEKFHELGLTKSQGEALASWYNGLGVQAAQEQQAQRVQQFQQEDADVRREWGTAFTQELAKAQAAARGLGLDAQTIDKLSDALGHKGTLQLLNKIGNRMGEDTFVSGDSNTQFGSAMTPAQAKAAIASRMADRDFVKQYTSGAAAARSEMERLHRYAYPDNA